MSIRSHGNVELMPSVKLFGSIHADRRSKVRRELASFASDADALFVEYPTEPYDAREYVELFIRAPLVTLGFLLTAVMQRPFYALFNRDAYPAEVLAARRLGEERDCPVVAVDEHYRGIVDAVGRGQRAIEWGILVGALVLAPFAVGGTVGSIALAFSVSNASYRVHRLFWGVVSVAVTAVVGWVWFFESDSLVVSGFILLLVLVFAWQMRATIGRRNEFMLDRIAAECAEHGYENVCLTTGYAHVFGLGATASEYGLDVAATYIPSWLRGGRTVEGAYGRNRDETVAFDADKPVFGRRIAALVVDWMVLIPVIAVGTTVGILVVGISIELAGGDFSSLADWQVVALLLGSAFLADMAYWTILESRYGKTVGKRLVGLVVVDDDDRRPGVRTALRRNILRPVDWLPFYVVGGLVALFTERGQRLGDLVANTRVVVADADDTA